MQQLKFFEGNLNPKVRAISSKMTVAFLFLFGALVLLTAVSAWFALATPRSSPPYAAWTGYEAVWGSVSTIVGTALIAGAWVHSKIFGYQDFRFSSSARHADVVRDIGAWLESRPYHSATLLLFSVGEVDSVYELQIVEPRSKDNGLLRSLPMRPPALPEGILRSTTK